MELIYVTMFWCMAGTDFSTWDAHHTHAAEAFMAKHPQQCFADGPTQLEPGVTLSACQSQAMVRWLPQWQQSNPGTIPIGITCEARQDKAEHLDLRAMKEKVAP